MDLQEFDFVVTHRPGTSNQNADALSRLNLKTTPYKEPTDKFQHNAVSCLVRLTPETSLRATQRGDPDIFKIIEMKEQEFPRPPPFVWKSSRNLFSYWYL